MLQEPALCDDMRSQTRLLRPEDVNPAVRYANYRRVPPGADWGPRAIPDLELILVVEGRFEYCATGEKSRPAGIGSIIAIPPGMEHVVRVADGCLSARFSCIHCELLPGRSWLAGDYRPDPFPPAVTDTEMNPVIHDLFQRCAAESGQFHPFRSQLLSAIVREIWLRMAGCWLRPEGRRISIRLARMAAFLRDNLERPVSRRDLARRFGITPEHVNALFKQELGTTPGEFIRRERVRTAYRLLADEGLSVKEAAARAGFADQFHFSRVFTRLVGCPPSRIRAATIMASRTSFPSSPDNTGNPPA